MIKNLTRIMHTKFGKIAISIILGLGLASLFKKACKNRNCLVFRAPPLDKIKKTIYKYDNKCYSFSPNTISCDSSKENVEFTLKDGN